jgi:hypothetical protein
MKKYERVAMPALYLATACACLVVASAIAGSIRYLRPGPGFDFWGAGMPFLNAAIEGPWSWAMLWEMSAGAHRLVVPRILFWIEWWVGDFQNYLLLAFAWSALAGSALLVLRIVWQDRCLDQHSRWLCLVLVLLGFGSAQHMNNLAYAFNMQWTFGLLFSLLFIAGVIRAKISEGSGVRLLSILQVFLSAFILTFTTFSLPILLFVWVFMAWGLRIRWFFSVPVSAAIVFFSFEYVSYLPIINDIKVIYSDGNPQSRYISFLEIAAYLSYFTLRYLGSPAYEVFQNLEVVLSFIVLIFLTRLCWSARISKDRLLESRPLFWLILGFSVFVFFMAIATGVGRLTDPGAAVSPRFRTFSMPFLTLSSIAVVCFIQGWNVVRRSVASFLLIVVFAGVVLPGHFRLLYMFSDEYDSYVTPVIAMAVGLSDKNVVHEARIGLWWGDDNVRMMKYRELLYSHRKGIYASPYFGQLGNSIEFSGNILAAVPESHAVKALPGGGFQWDGVTGRCGGDGRVALVNQEGVIVGAGRVSRALPDAGWKSIYRVFLPLCHGGEAVSWRAFLPATVKSGETFIAVTVDNDGEAFVASTVVP